MCQVVGRERSFCPLFKNNTSQSDQLDLPSQHWEVLLTLVYGSPVVIFTKTFCNFQERSLQVNFRETLYNKWESSPTVFQFKRSIITGAGFHSSLLAHTVRRHFCKLRTLYSSFSGTCTEDALQKIKNL